jgi:hypothetical protein
MKKKKAVGHGEYDPDSISQAYFHPKDVKRDFEDRRIILRCGNSLFVVRRHSAEKIANDVLYLIREGWRE